MSDMASAPTACPNKSRGNRGIVPVDDKSEHWLRSIEGTHRCACWGPFPVRNKRQSTPFWTRAGLPPALPQTSGPGLPPNTGAVFYLWSCVVSWARPYADPEKAARRLLEIANTIEPVQDGRIPHREDQLAIPVSGQGQSRGVRRRPEAGDRARLVRDARKRHVRPLHAGRRRAIRLIK
jgi:hypothetical protein